MKTIKIKFQYLGDFYDENYESVEDIVLSLEHLEELNYIIFEVQIFDGWKRIAHTTAYGEDELVEWVESIIK